MSVSEDVPTKSYKWSRLGHLARGVAMAQIMRGRSWNPKIITWTAEEDRVLTLAYPDYAKANALLPRRTRVALHKRASAIKLIAPNTRYTWKASEVALLRRAARERWGLRRVFEAMPHLTDTQIRRKYKALGLRFGRELCNLGIPLVDQIRRRAALMKLSLADLDAISGGGRFWRRSQRRMRWKAVRRVLEYMEGEIVLHFPPLSE